MEIDRIDHIHFKTKNRERDTRIFEALLGKKPIFDTDLSESHGVRQIYYAFPRGLQLVEVTNRELEHGQIYADVPEGIFGIALKVPDIKKAKTEMESMGHKLLYSNDLGPIKTATFIINALGLEIELMEFPGESVERIFEEALSKVRGDVD